MAREERERQTERQIDRQRGSQADRARETDRQTDIIIPNYTHCQDLYIYISMYILTGRDKEGIGTETDRRADRDTE